MPEKNVQCNQSVQIVIFIPLIGIPFLKNVLEFYYCCLIPVPRRKLPIPLAVGTNHYTFLPAREGFQFLLQSSASRKRTEQFSCILPLRYGIALLIYQANLQQSIDQSHKVD